jgi:hypothetical protein
MDYAIEFVGKLMLYLPLLSAIVQLVGEYESDSDPQ